MLLPTNCMSMFDHSVGLALKGLTAGVIFTVYKQECFIENKKNITMFFAENLKK